MHTRVLQHCVCVISQLRRHTRTISVRIRTLERHTTPTRVVMRSHSVTASAAALVLAALVLTLALASAPIHVNASTAMVCASAKSTVYVSSGTGTLISACKDGVWYSTRDADGVFQAVQQITGACAAAKQVSYDSGTSTLYIACDGTKSVQWTVLSTSGATSVVSFSAINEVDLAWSSRDYKGASSVYYDPSNQKLYVSFSTASGTNPVIGSFTRKVVGTTVSFGDIVPILQSVYKVGTSGTGYACKTSSNLFHTGDTVFAVCDVHENGVSTVQISSIMDSTTVLSGRPTSVLDQNMCASPNGFVFDGTVLIASCGSGTNALVSVETDGSAPTPILTSTQCATPTSVYQYNTTASPITSYVYVSCASGVVARQKLPDSAYTVIPTANAISDASKAGPPMNSMAFDVDHQVLFGSTVSTGDSGNRVFGAFTATGTDADCLGNSAMTIGKFKDLRACTACQVNMQSTAAITYSDAKFTIFSGSKCDQFRMSNFNYAKGLIMTGGYSGSYSCVSGTIKSSTTVYTSANTVKLPFGDSTGTLNDPVVDKSGSFALYAYNNAWLTEGISGTINTCECIGDRYGPTCTPCASPCDSTSLTQTCNIGFAGDGACSCGSKLVNRVGDRGGPSSAGTGGCSCAVVNAYGPSCSSVCMCTKDQTCFYGILGDGCRASLNDSVIFALNRATSTIINNMITIGGGGSAAGGTGTSNTDTLAITQAYAANANSSAARAIDAANLAIAAISSAHALTSGGDSGSDERTYNHIAIYVVIALLAAVLLSILVLSYAVVTRVLAPTHTHPKAQSTSAYSKLQRL
jgi:hypothetical protein